MNRLRNLLAPASQIYRFAAAVDRRWKLGRAFTSRLPVVSVGNISAGGSGKSQVVGALLGPMQSRWPVVLLSRGYGRGDAAPRLWRPGDRSPDPALFGDEPAMLSDTLYRGILGVASDRASLLASIEREFPDAVVLLDDGFQHHRLRRDLDIVLVDDRTSRERRLLPAGNLRELPAALSRADVILCDGETADSFARRHAPEVPRLRMSVVPRELAGPAGAESPPEGEPLLVTGIAAPERVIRSLSELGIVPRSTIVFRDHEPYTDDTIRAVLAKKKLSGAKWIVTTTKDAVKLRRFPEVRDLLYVLKVEMIIEEMPRLIEMIDERVRRKHER